MGSHIDGISSQIFVSSNYTEENKISGGTGITPFLQLLQYLAQEEPRPIEQFTLLHSSPTPRQLPPSDIMKVFNDIVSDSENKWLSVSLFVDSLEPMTCPFPHLQWRVQRIGPHEIREALRDATFRKRKVIEDSGDQTKTHLNTLVLVCGPERLDFVRHLDPSLSY